MKKPRQHGSLILSLVVHFIALTLLANFSTSDPIAKKHVVVELTSSYISTTSQKPSDSKILKRIVQTTLIQKSKVFEPNAFLGQQNQVVDRQTVSKSTQIGKSVNSKNQKNNKLHPNPRISMSDLGIKVAAPASKQQDPHSDKSFNSDQKPSEYIQGLKEGDKTALNTKAFVFYSYFQRIRKQLDLAWTRSLRANLMNLYKNGRKIAGDMDHITKVMVTLTNQGEVKKVQYIEESGTFDLDSAAVKAFNDAGPFPNPPKGIVDSNEEIQIQWVFILKS